MKKIEKIKKRKERKKMKKNSMKNFHLYQIKKKKEIKVVIKVLIKVLIKKEMNHLNQRIYIKDYMTKKIR